jgi:hypothetical protein
MTGLKATGQKAPCGGDFTKSAKEKAERACLHEDLARKANEAMFRANPELIAKAFDRFGRRRCGSPKPRILRERVDTGDCSSVCDGRAADGTPFKIEADWGVNAAC